MEKSHVYTDFCRNAAPSIYYIAEQERYKQVKAGNVRKLTFRFVFIQSGSSATVQ